MTVTVVIRTTDSNSKAAQPATRRMYGVLVSPKRKKNNQITGGIRNSAKARIERKLGKFLKAMLIMTG